ncbi:hypothetical protein AM493_15800 [Flavobacterium akiainvivens]|uniref:Outer membrane protein beta-barrel domain-containing protein n=1 Tax=Flavobacterium akiainvivens TaxID=1202724 RepID=A0A0M9VJ48_9FLAO|nr:hypothetical protein [Flavobacterium akiainvivens]KOS07339.1 hypothetical protein AM493_15800 [Flavobacterium akiainvivens]SFQ46871.1 hypothetical protein SAMN05444144_105141 [Flavobacterium akiainvivens]
MKKSLTLLLGLLAFANAFAQEPETTTPENTAGTVEKSIFTVQTGAIGFWASNELRLSNRWALRTEAGLDLWYYDTWWDGSGTALVPSISVEPRWYYNIEKRARKGKHTENNSASFVTLAVEYYPDLFVLGNVPSYLYVPDQITFIPKWGIRRAIAKSNFNYELGIGLGYLLVINHDNFIQSATDVGVDIHIRIGYTF